MQIGADVLQNEAGGEGDVGWMEGGFSPLRIPMQLQRLPDADGARLDTGPWNIFAAQLKPLDMKFNGVSNHLFDQFPRFSRGDTAG